MSGHEHPHLDTSDPLEYPNETWLRRIFARRRSSNSRRVTPMTKARACFRACADAFVDYSIGYLSQSPTAKLTRPIMLLLAYGVQRPTIAPPVAIDVSVVPQFARYKFTPLKQHLKKRMVLIGAGCQPLRF